LIVITGIGIVSALGIGKEGLVSGFLEGRSGISRAEGFDTSRYGIKLLGEVKDIDFSKYIPPFKTRRMSRFSQLSLCSAIEAVEDSGLEITEENRFRVGVIVGTGLSSTGSTDTFYDGILREGPLGCNPMVFPETVQNIAASHISIHFGIMGPNTTFSEGDISSELALFYATELLKDRKVDAVIVSGADELSDACLLGFSSLGILSKGREEGMMPFDKRRNGPVLGEGGATVVLERDDDAERRGAKIYCGILSPGFAASPLNRLEYDRRGRSLARAMDMALDKAGIKIIDIIISSANSTPHLDRAETEAIKEVFKQDSYRIPVSAIRSYTGFFMGDGILRIAGAALCMKEGIIPKTLGLVSPSQGCDLDYVIDGPRRGEIRYAMVNSLSHGGCASSMVLKRYEA